MRKETKKWKTKSGRKIRICDMTNLHLKNCIKFLQKMSVKFYEMAINDTASVMTMVNGDMASYYAESDFDVACHSCPDDYLPKIYYNLLADAERRNLPI